MVEENVAPLTFAQQTREMLESFAVAFMLMLLMRNCLGENYQIPTGSMAPTLQGRHVDVLCRECGHQYRAGASVDQEASRGKITSTMCPICRHPMLLDSKANPNHVPFSGDRIIVSKLAYLFGEPQRWDVIVFKCPADAKVNYIKRLIGLPGETVRIRHGDISILDESTADRGTEGMQFHIARKPPDKVVGMLQLVDDTYHVPKSGWPSRWVPVTPGDNWKQGETRSEFSVEAKDADTWRRYRHLVPRDDDWRQIRNREKPNLAGYEGSLITDYYAYNDGRPGGYSPGVHWVGDLAIESNLEITSQAGELLLDLVEGGVHFECRIDIATGRATLGIKGDGASFQDGTAKPSAPPTAVTSLQGPGEYSVRFANVDDKLFLWVNDEVVVFEGSTEYQRSDETIPQWSPEDPADFMPVAIGARQLSIRVSRLRVLRDVYYLAMGPTPGRQDGWDYERAYYSVIEEVLTNPRSTHRTAMFKSRTHETFVMGPDQFFPLGDNSPQSKDARLWSHYLGDGELDPPPAVDRELLIGKAISIYWPHAWYLPAFPVWPIVVPNYQRMGFIH
jgi:signal peptidase I